MKTLNVLGLVLLGFLLLAGVYSWSTYNKLISLNEEVVNKWAQVETQYQRRYDLIPNLVQSVKGIMEQEQEIFNALAEARTRYGNASSVSEKAEAASELEGAFSRLLVVMENYPELKSAENVQTLMVQLEGTENRISVERKRYNNAVRVYNLLIKKVPSKWVAETAGFEEKSYFESNPGAESAPSVDF